MSQRKCSSTQIKDQEYKPELKMHKRILRFFSKIDNSRQMGPLISYAIKRQHLIIPGPSRFKHRSAKDVRRVQLLERYDGDSFFSEQALKRLHILRMKLPGPAFLKLMQVLVAIFEVYLSSKDGKYRSVTKGQVKILDKSKMTKVSLDDNNNNASQCSVPSQGPMEKSIDAMSEKNIVKGKWKAIHQLKLKQCSENVESLRETGQRETLKNSTEQRVLSKGDNHHSENWDSRADNSSPKHVTVGTDSECVIQRTNKSLHKEQVDSSLYKNEFHSRSHKRKCPSPKGDNQMQTNKRRRTSCHDAECVVAPMDHCARLRVWAGSL